MNKSFGPWSTAITTGANQQLNTFWKRRLAMLPSLNNTASRAARRTWLFLAVAGALAVALPTAHTVTQPRIASAAGASAAAADLSEKGPADSIAQRGEKPADQFKAGKGGGFVEYLPRPTKEETALEEPLDFDVIEMPFKDCLKLFALRAKINVVLDYEAVANDGVVLDQDQPITLKLKGSRAGTVLSRLLQLLTEGTKIELGILFEEDGLKITTATLAGEQMIIRWYPVWDLQTGTANSQIDPSELPHPGSAFTAPRHIAQLIQVMTCTATPDSWEDLSGPGSVVYVSEIQCLLIRQTSAVHREILQLLRLWREAKRMERAAVAGTAVTAVRAPVRHERETYSLVGSIDLDDDGQEDSDLVRALLTAAGCHIHEFDAQGNLCVNGKVSEDGEPRIFAQTKFVVIGKVAEITADTSPDEAKRIRKLNEVRQILETQARKQGTQVVSLSDFLHYLGYKPRTDKSKNTEDVPFTLKHKKEP
jgi:hypothetical protein